MARSGTTAFISHDVTVTAGDDIGVRARDDLQFDALTGSAAIGFVGIGAAVAVANTYSNVEAYIDSNAIVRAGPDQGDDLLVLSELNSSMSGKAYAGAGGVAALSGQIVVLNDNSTVWSHLNDHASILRAGGTVTIEAISNRTVTANTVGLQIGGLAAGASIAIAHDGGFTKALAGDVDVGTNAGESVHNFNLLAGGNTIVRADATSVSAGAISVSAAVGIADVTAPIQASIATGANIITTGDVNVDISASGDATADAFGVNVGAAALGASVATASVTPSLLAFVASGVNINAGGNVGLRNSFNESRRSKGARATATAGAGGVIAGSGAVADATAAPESETYIASGSTITAGNNVSLVSIADDAVAATAAGYDFGAAGIGVTAADAFVQGHTRTHVDASTVHAVGDLFITASTTGSANTVIRGVAGGAVAGSFNVGRAIVTPVVEASLRSGANVESNDATIAASSAGFTAVDALGVAGSAFGSVAETRGEARLNPNLDAFIDVAHLHATGNVTIGTYHNMSGASVINQGSSVNGTTASGSLAFASGGSPIIVTAQADLDSRVRGGADLSSGGVLTVESRAFNKAFADGNISVGSGADISSIFVTAVSGGSTIAQIDQSVNVGGINIIAQGVNSSDAEARATTIGVLAAGSLVSANANVAPTITAQIANGLTINSTGSVSVVALSEGDAFAFGGGTSGGAFGAGVAEAHSRVQPIINATIGNNVDLTAGGGISVIAAHNYTSGGTLINKKSQADTFAPGGGVVSGKFTINEALANANTTAQVGSGATLDAGGTVVIASRSNNIAESNGKNITGGVISVSTVDSTANANAIVTALLDGNLTGHGGLTIAGQSNSSAKATAASTNGALLGGVGSSATAVASPTISASIKSGHTVDVDGLISLNTSSTGDASAEANGTQGGIAGIGIVSADATVAPNIDTYIAAGNLIRGGGGVSLSAQHNASGGRTASATASAPGGGVIAGQGASPTAIANADVDTYIASGVTLDGGTGTISVLSTNGNEAVADANVFVIGAVLGLGLSDAEATANGPTRAHMDGTILHGGGVNVQSTATNRATATADAAGGGIIGVNGAIANAIVQPTVSASITGAVDVTGGVTVRATANTSASAETFGGTGGLLGIGYTTSTASIAPDIDAFIGNVNVSSGAITIEALHNTSGANATSHGSGGGLIAGNFITANATNNANTQAYVTSGASIDATGTITINALSGNSTNARSQAATGGLIGVGTARANANSNGTVKAFLDGDITNGGGLSLFAQGTGNAVSFAESTTGGLIAGSVVTGNATFNPNISAAVNNGAAVNVSGNVSISSESQGDADAQTPGSVGGLVGIVATFATATLTPTVASFIGTTSITAGGGIALQSIHNFSGTNPVTSRNAHAVSTPSGGGLLAGVGGSATATANATVDTTVSSGAALSSGGDVSLISRSYNDANASTDGQAGGLIAVGLVNSNAQATGTTRARVLGGSITTTGAGDDLLMTALGSNNATAFTRATTGGAIDVRTPTATANAAPNVTASVNGTVDLGGSADIKAIANGDATSTARGTGGGIASIGTSRATANWSPTVTASVVGSNTSITADDDIRVRAYNNYDEFGNQLTGKRAQSNATASGGGVISVQGSNATSNINANIQANVAAGANLLAGTSTADDVEISSRSRANGEANADGVSGGLISVGSSESNVNINNSSRAFTSDGEVANPTILSGGGTIKIHAEQSDRGYADSEGFGGGLAGSGGSEARVNVNSPVTTARLGNGAVVSSDTALFEVSAEFRADLSSNTDQGFIAAVAFNDATSSTRITNGHTLAEIGSHVTVNVDRVLVSARDVDVVAKAKSVANVPFDFGGDNRSNATVNVQLKPEAHISGVGTEIHACGGVDIIAGYDKVWTSSDAYARTVGITGNVIATASNDKRVDVRVNVDSGVHIETNTLHVNAYTSNQPDNVDYIKQATAQGDTVVNYVLKAVGTVTKTVCKVIGEIVCAWGLICDPEEVCDTIVETVFDWVAEVLGATTKTFKPGSENITNSVNFNADVTLGCEPPRPTLLIDTTGFISGTGGFLLTDGEGRHLGNGQTVGEGPIFLNGLDDSVTAGNLLIQAAGGTTSGHSTIQYTGSPEAIDFVNRSSSDLVVTNLTPFSSKGSPTIGQQALHDHENWSYDVVSTNSTSTVFNITNDSAADTDIIIAGGILNPAGTVNIRNIGGGGGDILGSGKDSWINSRSIFLEADSGAVGTVNNRVNVRLPVSADFDGAAVCRAPKATRVWHWTSTGAATRSRARRSRSTNISSAHGSVDLLVHDAVAVNHHEVTTEVEREIELFGQVFKYTDFVVETVTTVDKIDGVVTLGDISAAQNLTIHVGDGDFVQTDVVIAGQVHAGGTVALTLTNGSVINGGGVISGHDIIIDAQNNGQVGSGDLFIVANVDGGEINAIADGNIFVMQTVGRMGVGSIVSLHGDVTLTSVGTIFDFNGDEATDVFGNNITMQALGSIGTFGNDLDIDSGFSGPGVVKAISVRGDIELHETNGDLMVASAVAPETQST